MKYKDLNGGEYKYVSTRQYYINLVELTILKHPYFIKKGWKRLNISKHDKGFKIGKFELGHILTECSYDVNFFVIKDDKWLELI